MWEFLREHLTLLRDGRIFTYGSYTSSIHGEDEPFGLAAKEGVAAGAIVCVNSNNWRNGDILAVTIADDTTARVCNSYAAELIALLGAHQMLHHLGVEQKEQCITTDCEAAQKTINGKRYKKWATAEQAQIIHGISRLNRQNIAWTPSHPERRHKNQLGMYAK